jgi:flagellar secretion chaperone FliS
MLNIARRRYLEAEVLGASPVKLVEMLYRAAIESVGDARRHLSNSDIRARSRSINKASAIVNELMRSLDHTRGGGISRGLVELYAYIQTRLIEANSRQIDPPLAEVEQLLGVLQEAWRAVPSAPETPASGADPEYVPVNCAY